MGRKREMGDRAGKRKPQPGCGAAPTVRKARLVQAGRAVKPGLAARVRGVALRCARRVRWVPRWQRLPRAVAVLKSRFARLAAAPQSISRARNPDCAHPDRRARQCLRSPA